MSETSIPLFDRYSSPMGETEPFHGDRFERKKLADRLTGLIKRIPKGAVISLDAPWGDGKTWFGRR